MLSDACCTCGRYKSICIYDVPVKLFFPAALRCRVVVANLLLPCVLARAPGTSRGRVSPFVWCASLEFEDDDVAL